MKNYIIIFILTIFLIILISDVCSFLVNPAVLNINLLRCMFKKEYACPHEDIDFRMYSPTARYGKLIDVRKPKTFNRAGFNSHTQTVFIIHGFNGTSSDKHIRYLRDAYVSRDYNVITVDWKRLTYYPCYFSALSNTRLVAQCTAQMYSYLTYTGVDPKQMTCVGHSLGAHICGMMSTHLTAKQYRIIGLDPARPLIEKHASRSYRLTRDDAKHVQIIHTNAGALGQFSFSGSLDLCINGGRIQPYCTGNIIRKQRCSHFLSVCYLANALFKHKLFPAVPCPEGCLWNNPKVIGTGASQLVNLMHIGSDVSDFTKGGYCVEVDFARHCPFND